MGEGKSIAISFRVTPEIKRLLELASLREQRSQTNLLEKLLLDYCLAAGLMNTTTYRMSADRIGAKDDQ